MKTKIVHGDNKCWFCKWVHKFYKNVINYSECSKCGARKAVGPDKAKFSNLWLDGKTDMVKTSPEKKDVTTDTDI